MGAENKNHYFLHTDEKMLGQIKYMNLNKETPKIPVVLYHSKPIEQVIYLAKNIKMFF